MLELTHDTTIHGTIVPPRYDDAITAVFMLRGAVKLWEADGQAANLDRYLCGRTPGKRNPLGNLRPYRPFQAVVEDAAAVLTVSRP